MEGERGMELEEGDERHEVSEENADELQLGLGGAFEPKAAAFLFFVHYVSLSASRCF